MFEERQQTGDGIRAEALDVFGGLLLFNRNTPSRMGRLLDKGDNIALIDCLKGRHRH
jgi:hypothetical protein